MAQRQAHVVRVEWVTERLDAGWVFAQTRRYVGALLLAAGIAAYLRATRRRAHEPRALELLEAPRYVAPRVRKFAEAVMYGEATFRGVCTRCGGRWLASSSCAQQECIPGMPHTPVPRLLQDRRPS